MRRLLQQDEWIVFVAILPGLLAAGGLGAEALFSWDANAPLHIPTERSSVCLQPDNYVQGLAKRGIARMPGYYDPNDATAVPAAVIAEAQLRARNVC
jgi:hypothetical protein